jgi:chromosome segregation ATPase
MKYHLLPLVLVLTLAPGIALANGNGTGVSQQPKSPAIEFSHAVLPDTVDQAASKQNTTTQQSPLSLRDQFQNCSRLAAQTRDRAHALVDSASHLTFTADLATRQHKELQESIGNLKQEHERFFKTLTPEQQNSIQMRNANLLQAQNRLQDLVKEMERELTDSTLHSKDVAEQARATQREAKSYQKEFRALGKDLGFSND